ncbi:unnamed protein product [Symbiodinium natans]|uniref:Uncharacterized protein n=1 Tax=Symbiodinium natans TaxID=878477 RepID=A0A812MKE7_9DINO|nr:unnamed protein product [Symbiodinium natans]
MALGSEWSGGSSPARKWWGPLDGPKPDLPSAGTAPSGWQEERKIDPQEEQLAIAAKNEAAQLRRKLKSLRAEIAKRNAALELLPGGSLLGADQLLRGFRQVSLRSFWELVREGNSEALRQDDGFVQCVGKSCFQGQDAHVMPALDITACKQLCRAGTGSGAYGAFVVQGGYAFFRQQPVGQCRQQLRDEPNATTYLNSSLEAAALCADIRKAVARRQELRKQDRRGEAAPAANSAPMVETWRSLEAELRRKSTHSLELHRRVHDLEEELQKQLQGTDTRMEQVLSAVRSAAMHLKSEAARNDK